MARKPRWQERKQNEWYKEAVKHVSDHALAEHEADRDPNVWSANLLHDYGAEVWAHCHSCRVDRNVPLEGYVGLFAQRPIRALPLRCRDCGTVGEIIVKWWSMAGTLCFYNLTTGEHKGGWKLLLKPPYPSHRAEPIPDLSPLESPKGYRVFEPMPLAGSADTRSDDTQPPHDTNPIP